MKIEIAATKTCTHRPVLEEQLKDAGLPYEVIYFEEHPELVKKYGLKTSPVFIVDDEIVSIGMPSPDKIVELKREYENT